MRDSFIKIFTGSDIDANYIASMLTDNNIKCIIQNIFEESITAGWANGSPYNSSIIQVHINDLEKAKTIVNEYVSSLNK